MTQQLVGPDGTIHEFPDEATPAMIAQALGVQAPTDADLAAAQSAHDNPQGNAVQYGANALGMGTYPLFAREGGVEAGLALGQSPQEAYQTGQQSVDELTQGNKAFEQRQPAGAALLNAAGALPGTMMGLGAADLAEGAALRYAPAMADFLAGRSTGAAALPSMVTAGAKTGAEAGVLQSGTNDNSVGSNALTGAMVGGPLGPAGYLARAAVPGPVINPEVAALVPKAQALGVDLRAPQIGQGKTIQGMAQGQDQGPAFTKAASHTIGADTDSLTHDSFQAARDNIGKRLDTLTPRLQISSADTTLLGDLANVETGVNRLPPDSPARTDVENAVRQVQDEMARAGARPPVMTAAGPSPGTIPGAVYQDFIKKGGMIDQLYKSNPAAAGQIRDALDDAVERASPPGVLAPFQEARQQWKNSVILEPLVDKASPHGILDPTQLKARVDRAYSNPAAAGDIGTLGDAGQYLPATTKQGGEKEAPSYHGAVHWPGGIAGTALGAAGAIGSEHYIAPMIADHPLAAALTGTAAAVGVGARSLVKSAANSAWYRDLLLNRLARTPTGVPNGLIAPSVAAMNTSSR